MAVHTAIPSRDTLHIEEYDEDYEEERAIEYIAILSEEDRLLHYSSWKRNATSIDRSFPTSIDTHLHQTCHKRASTDIAYYHRSSLESTVHAREITQLAIGQMIAITRAMQ